MSYLNYETGTVEYGEKPEWMDREDAIAEDAIAEDAAVSTTEDIGRRWVAACERAGVSPWAQGMLTTEGYRVVAVDCRGQEALQLAADDERCTWHDTEDDHIPNLTDDATRGDALGILRRAWGDPGMTTVCKKEAPRWTLDMPAGLGHFHTEAEALVAAMEALPEVSP